MELLTLLDKPNYDPAADLEAIFELTLEKEEFVPEKLYNQAR